MINIPQHGNGLNNRHYKTNICRHFEMGNCSIGSKCQFAHGSYELRKPSDPLPQDIPKIEANLVITNFKTVLCKYNQGGFCKNSENCSYAHGSNDRKEARVATLLLNEQNIDENIPSQQNDEILVQQLVSFFINQLETLLPNLDNQDKSLINKTRELNKQGKYLEATKVIIQMLQSPHRSEEDRYIYQSFYKNALTQFKTVEQKNKLF